MKNLKNILIVLSLLMTSGLANAEFVFAHINESIGPIDRGEKYEDPLMLFLHKKSIGDVTGGGSSLSSSGNVEWVGIDIELTDPNKNIIKVVNKLKDLGVPSGSFLEFRIGDKQNKVFIK